MLLLNYLIIYPILIWLAKRYVGIDDLTVPIAFIVTIAYFIYGGTITIDTGFVGVPTVFGGRIPWFQLPEGTSLILPRPLMSAIPVDMREQVIKIDPAPADVTSGQVLTMGTLGGSGKKAMANIAGELKYKVNSPYGFLSVTDAEDRLANKALSILRTFGGGETLFEFIEKKDAAANIVATHSDMVAEADACGVIFLGFLLRKILPTNASLITAAERQLQEELERAGEEVEVAHVIKQVRLLSRKLNITEAEASELFQVERNKATREFVHLRSEKELTAIERAALLNSRRKGGKP